MNRQARAAAFLSVFLILLIGSCTSDPQSHIQAPVEEPFTVVFVGDILLGDDAQELLDEHGYLWTFENLGGLTNGDYLIGNGESPITSMTEPWDPDQRWSYNADPQAAAALAAFGFDALGYSNNHALDRGPEGLADTAYNLYENGIEFFGAGQNEREAAEPLLVETPYGIIGVVALSEDWGADRTAGADQAGSIPLSKESIQTGYQLAKDGGADWVIAYVHWGTNYSGISSAQHRWAREFARSDYALVVGHGAHSLQEIELVQGIPVLYSIGNFVFNTPGRFTEEYPGYGLVVSAGFGPDGLAQIELGCLQTDNQIVNFQPQPCPSEQAQIVFGWLSDRITIKDGVATFTWE
jgi:cyanophycin synthetase